ncbi:MAG: acyl-CoA dehydrogenase family protein [Steroidobacteraceae bacterium]
MDMELNADQQALVDATEQLLGEFKEAPRSGAMYAYSAELQQRLAAGDFASVSLQSEYGALEAALIVEVLSRAPYAVECGASVLVAPAVLYETLPGPIALVEDWQRPARFLSVARHAFIRDQGGGVLMTVESDAVETAPGMLAYPYGRFKRVPEWSRGRRLSAQQSQALLQWWRTSIALEAAAAMGAATRFTVDYVTNRRQFGRPIGSFQAIQHRLARGTVHSEGARLIALEAAAKGDALTSTLAATYVSRFIGETVEDMHQFNGALGITLDHPLHYWTYRLLALQSELGGLSQHSRAAADVLWSEASEVTVPSGPSAYWDLGW